ncbi:MAG: M23 family metallopeptidase [Lachnospiraceae bacterium]|nr:M23 family metallopeptidase [Lachnospiraceae bacterium]
MFKNKKIRWSVIKGLCLAIIVSAFFLPNYVKYDEQGNTIFYVWVNGVKAGSCVSENVEDLIREARRRIAAGSDSLVLIDADVEVRREELVWGKVDSEETLVEQIARIMKADQKETLQRSYTIKINEYTVNLGTSEEVLNLLNAVLDKYDGGNLYNATLVMDPERELNVLTTQVVRNAEERAKAQKEDDFYRVAGMELYLQNALESLESSEEKDFEDYELGLIDLSYGDTVEVVEAYLPQSALTPVDRAIEEITKDQEKNKIYEVVAGDTLSQIAEDNGLSMEKLVEMNPTLESASSMIRVGDELIITSPEPELSVIRQEEMYYEEDYDADIIYIDNDEWYTTDRVTRQEPSAGHRKVVAVVTFRNNTETSREIEKEEITIEAVPKIVERGTKIPPTYLKPISGGRLSSGFGRRKAPTKGASTYHKGVDWATPVGTAVMASCGGTVAKAGWGSGYGYVVYINHPDGRQTRYGHLSKVLVKPGQSVSQGQKIALSGNTGRSTGPHLHFEILIGGSQVDPFKYMN